MEKRWPNVMPRGWTPWRLVVAVLGVLLIAVVVIGVSAFTPPSDVLPAATAPAAKVNAVQADATATPTPRVIAIPQSTPAPTSSPTMAAVSTRPAEMTPAAVATQTQPELPTVTATPWLLVADEPAATSPPTIASSPTPLPSPAATLIPTPSPAPTLASPSPTVPPPDEPAPRVQVAFAAADWTGGYYRADGRAYGRPWTAIYGSASDYPRAALAFVLDAAPVGPATLTIVGLDDEWAAPNEIALEINGQTVFSGASPFANWDGVGDGANAAWTSVQFRLPPGSFRAGTNEVAVANLTPADSFNAPPYVLLSEASLVVSTTGEMEQVQPVAKDNEKKAKPAKDHQAKTKQKGKQGNGHGAKKGHKKAKRHR